MPLQIFFHSPPLTSAPETALQASRAGGKMLRPPAILVWWLIAACVVWVRWRLLEVPLDRDEGEYAYMGQLMLHGVPPYREAYNMKLPGVYGAYALLEWVFGSSVRGLRLGFLFLNLATMASLFGLARHMFGSKSALWATAAFAILSQSANFLAMSGTATHFINACVVPGFWLLLRAGESRRAPAFLGAGLCFGLAFLMKQQAVFLVLAAWGYALFSGRNERGLNARGFNLRGATIFGLGAAFPYATVSFWLWRSGDFASFWFWTVEYARAYTQLVSLSDAAANFALRLREFGFDWILLGTGLVGGLFGICKLQTARALWLGWLGGAALSVLPGFYFRPHYFIPLVPVICLGIAGGWHAWQISPQSSPRPQNWFFAPAVIACLALWTPLVFHFPLWSMRPEAYARAVYPGNPFVEAQQIAAFLGRAARPGERIAVIGSEPQIYFSARRRAATGFLYAYPLMENQPFARQMQHQMASEIERQNPEWLVFEHVNWAWGQTPQSERFIFNWFRRYQRHYRCVAVVEMRPEASRWNWNPPASQSASQSTSSPYLAIWRRKPASSAKILK